MSVELAPEDSLRLHVLLAAGDIQAVRIDENQHQLHALTGRGEAKLALHPVGRADRYLSRVRELLGGHALGSPGGYPVHLRGWTRLGQGGAMRLDALLKLGEPEAVRAVANAADLTDELARRVWWACPEMDIARSMLRHPAVRAGEMATLLSDYLVEHLPFEADPVAAMHSVRAVVAAGRIDEAAAQALWSKGQRRPHYLIGFLEAAAENLPQPLPARELPVVVDGPWGEMLAANFSANGQAWLRGAALALDKPPAHDAVYLLIDLLLQRFAPVRALPPPPSLRAALPAETEAITVLAALTADEAWAILVATTAVGPLMRRKLAPVIDPLLDHLRSLAP